MLISAALAPIFSITRSVALQSCDSAALPGDLENWTSEPTDGVLWLFPSRLRMGVSN